MAPARVTRAEPAPPVLRVPNWERIPALVHGFYGRVGGGSRNQFGTLNLSFNVGDAPEAVRDNWRRVGVAAGGEMRFVTMQQVHGAHIARVDERSVDVGEADGLVTATAGVALCVLAADCVPILLVAPRARAVAAVHAGWRGTVAGIVAHAVRALTETCGAETADVRAAMGPAIGGCCYEVDRTIVETLQERWGPMPDAVTRSSGAKCLLDLRRSNAAILRQAGVASSRITTVGPCTKCLRHDYFSHRAASAEGQGGTTGRQLSFIGMRPQAFRPTRPGNGLGKAGSP